MKRYKTNSRNRKQALNYYYEHRERILAYVKSKYKHKGTGKCKICGKDLSDLPNRSYRYCETCINDKNVSRQAIWYRRHKDELKLKRKQEKTKNKKKGVNK